MKKQGLRGAAIGGSVAGEEFADPKFHPVWAKAEELGAVLFIHPQTIPELAKRLKGNGWLTNTIALPTETTIALSHLIFEGTLDRFPGLKIISAHGGGYLPHYADRSDHACLTNPAGCDPNIKLKKKPTEYLKQLYFDSLIFSPEALRHLAAQVGVSQIMLGSDHPYPWQDRPVDHSHGDDEPQRRRKDRDPRRQRGARVQLHDVARTAIRRLGRRALRNGDAPAMQPCLAHGAARPVAARRNPCQVRSGHPY